jgi:Ca-activated chloride channel family protein
VPLAACGTSGGGDDGEPFRILSASENQTLEPLLRRWADDKDVRLEIKYAGSVDIMLTLEAADVPYDAVWPANSMWIGLGDTHKVVKYDESIMRSPVVFGVKRSVADRLGWVGRDVRVADILAAAETGDLTFMMTSASQSNSGATAYLGFLYAFAGNPEVLTSADLERPEVQEQIKRILGEVDRSSGSSGWLKDLFVQRYADFDAMVNYESVVIEANQQLTEQGKEPLYAIYPVDGLTIADSPLAYVSHGDAKVEERFKSLQTFLLSESVQKEILGLGRRVGLIGLTPEDADPKVFNPDWNITVDRVLSPIRLPDAEVIREALDLYQTVFRKPSFTIFALDFSGSMEGKGEADLTEAMRTLLDQETARRYLLQPSPDDVTVVIPFNEAPIDQWIVRGNDPSELSNLFTKIENLSAGGGTDIYEPVAAGLETFAREGIGDRFPAVILMTDGRSNEGSFDELRRQLDAAGLGDVPIFAILFGDADESQLEQITTYTSGRIFDGQADLVAAFRQAKGYN